MKNYFQDFLGGLLLIVVVMLFQTGCISDGGQEPTIDPNAGLEKTIEIPDAFPLENMRMDAETAMMLGKLRGATAKYHDLDVALADGYIQGSVCVSSPSGGMGFHYVLGDAIDGEFDYTNPEALLYEMDKNGQMKLVGVEYIMVAELWDLENEMPPYFGAQVFDEVPAPVPLDFDNYQLHVWIWKNNPNGIFIMFNPNVECN